jgi:hypothetical protein
MVENLERVIIEEVKLETCEKKSESFIQVYTGRICPYPASLCIETQNHSYKGTLHSQKGHYIYQI